MTEPWKAEARLVTGPIVLPCEGGGTYTIARCQFYACIGLNQNGEYTANFGIGCVTPWKVGDTENGLQSPLSYDPDYTCVQVDYAPVDQVLECVGRAACRAGLAADPEQRSTRRLSDDVRHPSRHALDVAQTAVSVHRQ